MRTRRSAPPLASVVPSGEKATAQTPCEWPRNVFTSRQSAVQYLKKSTGGTDAAAVSEELFTSEPVVVRSNIGRVLSFAARSLIGQLPGQYNSNDRSNRKRCLAAKSTLRPFHLWEGTGVGLTVRRFKRHHQRAKPSSYKRCPRWVIIQVVSQWCPQSSEASSNGNQIPTGFAPGSDRLVR